MAIRRPIRERETSPSAQTKTQTVRRRRKVGNGFLSTVAIIGIALVLFVVTVGIGVYLLGIDRPARHDESALESDESGEGGLYGGLSSLESSLHISSEESALEESEEESSASSLSPGTVPDSFDASVLGDSGFSNIANFKQINPDVKGWLSVPGTNINYPVLFNGDSVYYYLDKDIYKQKSKNAVIYADPYVKFGSSSQISKNTVLYGHNWTNYSANPRIGDASDEMFAQLTAYHHLNVARAYPYIYYSTADQEMTWVIFAAFYTDVSFYYNIPDPDDAFYAQIISGAKARSRHNFDVDVNTSDKILTLSTCTRAYGSSDQQRFVVMARLLRPGETPKAVNVTANPNPVLPKL
jgi:sortase B